MHESEKWKWSRKKKKNWSRSVVSVYTTPWTVAYQAPPSMGFSRQEYWSGLPFPSPLNTSSTSQIITAKNANRHWRSPRRQKLLLVENHCPGHRGIEKTIFNGTFLNSSRIETMRKTLYVIVAVSSHKVLGWSLMWQETPWLSPLRCLWPYKDTDALSSAAWERSSFCRLESRNAISLGSLIFRSMPCTEAGNSCKYHRTGTRIL